MDTLAMLRLQIEWGADEALEDAPIIRLRPPAAPSQPMAPASASIILQRPAPPAPVASPAERAIAAAGQAGTLAALREAMAGFDGCGLRDTATNLVFAAGEPDVGVVLVGDPPNADDDRSGQPFSGADGQLLDTMLTSAGLDRSGLLLAPLLPWRPPGGRPANPGEVTVCLPFLHRLIVLTAPRCLVIAGPQAQRALLGARPRTRGAERTVTCAIPGLEAPLDTILLPFPATALRRGVDRKEAWAALRRLRRLMDA